MRVARWVIASVAALAAGASQAASFGGIDLSSFDFDVVNYAPGSNGGIGGNATASGTSNGIGWSIGPTNLWSGRTTTNDSFQFSVLPGTTDNLHTSIGFTITFLQPIAKLLVALDNDNTTDSINFGVTPTQTQGLTLSGTQITLSTAAGGGLALFEFAGSNTLTITHTDNNGVTDGFDLAFHAIAVPEPGSYALMLAGLGVIAVRARAARRAGR
jgi:hypothetical protein